MERDYRPLFFMPQHPNTTRKQTQAKNKKSQKTKFLAFLATYERCAMLTEKSWSGKTVSNRRPQPWQGCALPTELFPLIY
jgi:hypothetical protein